MHVASITSMVCSLCRSGHRVGGVHTGCQAARRRTTVPDSPVTGFLRPSRPLVTAAALTFAVATALPQAASADDTSGPTLDSVRPSHPSLSTKAKISSQLRAAKGKVTVMVELQEAPAAVEYADALGDGAAAASKASKSASAAVAAQAKTVTSSFDDSATRATVLFSVRKLYAGVAVRTDASKLSAISALPGVKAIHRITPLKPQNASTVPLIHAPAQWSAGRAGTGKGISVGIIDTGIDYTHANFGGPGTVAAYEAAHANETGPWTPTAKVVGGYDFAGDSYNADPAADDYNPVPSPDINPLDCEGHGSHVAGTAAGLGVTKAGKTYTGPYSRRTDFRQFGAPGIGPGVAPGADLYALRVFGCTGSTDLTTKAIDWAADPNGDGDVSDHLDVINMSLGGSYGTDDSPDAVAANNAVRAGVTVVSSAGNSDDVTDIGTSPGDALRGISVAATDDTVAVADAVRVTAPASIAGLKPAQRSIAYDWAAKGGLTTPTAIASIGTWPTAPTATGLANADGCEPFSAADAAKVAGKVALLWWTDDSTIRRCGSAARGANARLAGAVGAIYVNDQPSFSAGITGDPIIPVMQIVESAGLELKANEATARVQMLYSDRNSTTIYTPETKDTLASFSSRGERTAGNMKPDVSAPGVSVFSTSSGTGNEGESESGTSMAAPHVAGVAALVQAAHPRWSAEQVKAAIMGTAFTNVRNAEGEVYGPTRAGVGRVDARAAAKATILAYNRSDRGAVSVSFGPLQTVRDTTRTKVVRVQNTGRSTRTLSLRYAAVNRVPGVTYTVSPAHVRLRAGASADVRVRISVDTERLRTAFDPTQAGTDPSTGLQAELVTEATGRLVVSARGKQVARVAVASSVRPASSMSGRVVPVDATTSRLVLSGRAVDQGTYQSSLTALELQGVDERLPACATDTAADCVPYPSQRAADVRYVAAGSTVPGAGFDDGYVYFGATAWAPWDTAADAAEFDVYIDTNKDGEPDYVTFNTRIDATANLFVAATIDLATGDTADLQLVNDSDGSRETGLYDATSLVMPVLASAIGLDSTSSSFDYWVESGNGNVGLLDTVGSAAQPFSFDAAAPALAVTARPSGAPDTSVQFIDAPGRLTIRKDAAAAVDQQPKGLWLLHHLNRARQQTQVLRVPLG